jgi:hypothetical protein
MSYDLNALAQKMDEAIKRAAITRTESVRLDLWAPEARDLLTLLRHHITRVDPAGLSNAASIPETGS